MIKTVTLSGAEVRVAGLGGQNVIVRNLGSEPALASAGAGVQQGGDGVAEIPPGGGEVIFDANGTVYLKGAGAVQVTGTNYSTVNFKTPSAGAGNADGGCEATTLPCIRGDDGACEEIEF